MLVEITPRMSANAPMLSSHTIRLARSERSACAVGEESSRRRGSARLVRRQQAGADVAAWRRSGRRPASSSTLAATGSKRTSGWAPVNGRSSSAQPSGVAQRSQPAPAGGVGDHSQQQEQRRRPRSPSSSAIRRVGRELARERAHADEHGHDRHRREREIGRSARRQAAGEEGRRTREPQEQRRPRRSRPAPRDRRSRARPSPASTSSMRPVSSSVRSARTAASSAEDRGDDRERPADAPGGVAADASAGRAGRRRTGGAPCCRRSCGRTRAGSTSVG